MTVFRPRAALTLLALISLLDLAPLLGHAAPPDPTVSVAAPSPAAGQVTVVAKANKVQRLASVEIYIDNVKKTTCTSSTCDYNWDTRQAADGHHSVLAKAIKKGGSVAASSSIDVLVANLDVLPPVVSLTVPSTVSGSVIIQWSATDANGVVETRLYLDGGLLGTYPSAAAAISFDSTQVADGPHTLQVAALDPTGNLGFSPVATMTVVNYAAGDLSLSVTGVTSSTVTIAWTGSAGLGPVSIYVSPEPASTPDGPLPDPQLVTQLPDTVMGCTLTGLAAATDVFIRIEAGGAANNAHVRTLGGPRTVLDTPLREVHAYGPNVLMLVLANPGTTYNGSTLTGNLGAAWQAGTWTIRRRDSSIIDVTAVYRHSLPVSQPDYPVAFGRYGNDNVVDVDHRIFLVLAQPIGARELLSVSHTGEAETVLQVMVPFSDQYLETPLIQVNQVGYNPRATRRWAYVYGWIGDGGNVAIAGFSPAEVLKEPLDPLNARQPILTGLAITQRVVTDADSGGGPVGEINLAALPDAEGVRYRVRIPGVGVSWPTAVSEEAAFKAFYVVARGLFHNRWCGNLAPQYTEWSRLEDHCLAYFVEGLDYRDGFFPSSYPQTDPRPVRGGHHDAGDFDLRPYHVLVAQDLLRAYELAADRLTDGQLTLPESGNGVPDLLDEAVWSVAAWEQLQNPDGSVRAGVESWRHPAGIYFANDDLLPYWTYDPVVWHTAYASGLFAQAAALVQPFDATRSAALEEAARRAYAWAQVNNAPVAYLLYAAGELYRLTGEAQFATDYQARWSALDKWGGGPFDRLQYAAKIYPGTFVDPNQQNPMADFTMAYALSHPPDALTATTATKLTAWADARANAILNSPRAHRNGRDDNVAVDWGGLVSTGRHVDTIYQRLQLGGLSAQQQQDYYDALSLSADYVLGCNPNSYSFITGLGSRNPQEPLHLDSLAFIKTGMPPVPGIPTYGPVASYPGTSYYQPQGAAFYPTFASQPLAVRTADTRASVNMNEFSVWEMQAPLAQLFTSLIGMGMQPSTGWLPGGSEHGSTLPSHTAE